MPTRGGPHRPPPRRLGARTKPPCSVQMFGVPAGHQLLTAVATDALGAASYSVPVLIQVAFVPQPVVAIRYAPPSVIIDWTPSAATLEQAPTVTGPWQPVSGASPPLTLVPTGRPMFFRARLPLACQPRSLQPPQGL